MTLVAWAVVDKDGRLVEPSCDGQLYVYQYESAAIQYGAPTDGERVVRVEVKIKRVEVTIKEE